MLVHLLVVQLAFLLQNARRSWQGSKACAKTCTTRRGSGHVDVEQIKRDDNKQSYQHRPQKGRQQNKETQDFVIAKDTVQPATRPMPRQTV